MSDLFGWFLLALRFSATNSGIKKNSDDVHWNVWTKAVRLRYYFQKKNYKYEILNHLYFGPSFVIRGTALGHFSWCFFFNFLQFTFQCYLQRLSLVKFYPLDPPT